MSFKPFIPNIFNNYEVLYVATQCLATILVEVLPVSLSSVFISVCVC